MSVRVKSHGIGLLAALRGGAVFVAIVLSVPMIAVLLSPGGLRGLVALLLVTVPFGLVFFAAASIVLTLLRISVRPERDLEAIGLSRYRYEVAAACIGAVALPLFVFFAAEGNPWAFGSAPVGAIGGWIAAAAQKQQLNSESQVSSSRPSDDQ